MSLSDGYFDLAPGKLANVVTCLELRSRPLKTVDAPAGAVLHRLGACDLAEYRSAFRRIGAPYLWFSRLALSDAELERVLSNPEMQAYVVRHNGGTGGFLELDFRAPNECELCFIGVGENLQGKGYGRWLINQAAMLAWSRPIERFWLHTCNLDHPRALAFYMREGFVPYKRQIEISDDPRVAGLLPLDAAPHIPIV